MTRRDLLKWIGSLPLLGFVAQAAEDEVGGDVSGLTGTVLPNRYSEEWSDALYDVEFDEVISATELNQEFEELRIIATSVPSRRNNA